jgi:hypothetical protein
LLDCSTVLEVKEFRFSQISASSFDGATFSFALYTDKTVCCFDQLQLYGSPGKMNEPPSLNSRQGSSLIFFISQVRSSIDYVAHM